MGVNGIMCYATEFEITWIIEYRSASRAGRLAVNSFSAERPNTGERTKPNVVENQLGHTSRRESVWVMADPRHVSHCIAEPD